MATLEKRKGRPRGRSVKFGLFQLGEVAAKRASQPKTFGDLPEILQLKIFEMAKGPDFNSWGMDVRTPQSLSWLAGGSRG